MSALEDLISGEGEPVVFPPEQTEISALDYLTACSENDEAERVHRAAVMKDASRNVFF
jgi:hypothetical protein